jgi:hypothetical protein
MEHDTILGGVAIEPRDALDAAIGWCMGLTIGLVLACLAAAFA